MSEYSYNADDQSLLTPPLYKFFVDPLLTVLPQWLPANFITLFSFLFVIAAFAITINGYFDGHYDYWFCIPLFFFCYLIGDCSDGKQARKTGTGSPLGEYFDHFLDSFVSGLLMGILVIAFRVTNPVVMALTFFIIYLGQIATFWERYHNKPMYFAKLSSSEAIITASTLAWLASFTPIRNILLYPVFGLPIGNLLCFLLLPGVFFTVFHAIRSTKTVTIRLACHLIFSLTVTVFSAVFYRSNMLYVTLLITFYNVLFQASLLAATVLKTKEGLPDIIIPISCIALYTHPEYTAVIQYAQLGYLTVRIIIRFAAFFKLHKQYWYWVNPIPKHGTP